MALVVLYARQGKNSLSTDPWVLDAMLKNLDRSRNEEMVATISELQSILNIDEDSAEKNVTW
jgi:hypothetical protein